MQNLFKLGLFLCTVIIIVQLFPSHDAFNYKYEVGKPWMHEPLAAPFDFPVYKSETQLVADIDSAMKQLLDDGTLSEVSIEWFGYDVYELFDE